MIAGFAVYRLFSGHSYTVTSDPEAYAMNEIPAGSQSAAGEVERDKARYNVFLE